MMVIRSLRWLIILFSISTWGQFHFSGEIDQDFRDGEVYLSIIEDYRKIDGLHSEQILQRTTADSLGVFHFRGSNLPKSNRIYRIHIDTCPDDKKILNHFSGHCENSREVIFIANNSDSLVFPFSFDNQMFCFIEGTKEKASAILRIDSLQSEMKYNFAAYPSDANDKVNTQNWFEKLQDFGTSLEEPLAELYIFRLLSDRGGRFYDFYLNDLSQNSYYEELLGRLQNKYPETLYAKQLEEELEADKFVLDRRHSIPWWAYALGGILVISFLINFFIIGKWLRYKKQPQDEISLSKQEARIKALILDGKSNKEIAQELFISVSTVKTHINNLYKKLGIRSRDELKNL